MNLFQPPAHWYCILAVLMSLYQGVRGFMFQNQFALYQVAQNVFSPCAGNRLERWITRALNDAWRYFISTLAGFASLLLAYRILNSQSFTITTISAGAATSLVFLVLFGILGVTGLLPDFLAKLDKFTT